MPSPVPFASAAARGDFDCTTNVHGVALPMYAVERANVPTDKANRRRDQVAHLGTRLG